MFHLHVLFSFKGLMILLLSSWRLKDCPVFAMRSQCPEEVSRVDKTQGKVAPPRWQQTFNYQAEVYSDPLCLEEDFHVVRRECAETWLPKIVPNCSYVSPRKSKFYCPPGYDVVANEDEYVCVGVSKERWSNTCRFSPKAFDDVDDDILFDILIHLQNRGVHTAWLPIKRLDNFGPLLWTIPGPMWGSRFRMNNEFAITYGDRSKGCLILDVSKSLRIKAESCDAIHPYLCIVGKNYFVQGACPVKYISSPIPDDNRCFRLKKSGKNFNWMNAMQRCTTAQIDSPLIEQLFSGLARKYDLSDSDFCWIGGDGRYKSNTMAMNIAGQKKNFNTTINLPCVFCQMDEPIHPVTSISLKFYQNEKQLILSVYDEEGLWKLSPSDPGIRCSSNANGDFIRNVKIEKIWDKRWTERDIEPDVDFEDRVNIDLDFHKTIYRVQISDEGPGYYVCEAHTVNGELLTTKQVIAYRELEGHTFALGLEIMDQCRTVEACDPTYLKLYENLAKDIEEETPETLIKNIRPMQILDITADGNVTILFHVTATKLDDEDLDTDSVANAYRRLKRLFQLLAAVHPKVYRYIFIRSCDGCLSTTTGKENRRLSWPFTPVGVTTVSEELCLDASGFLVHRTCKGNYMRGGSWSEPSGECISDVPPFTEKLRKISKEIEKSGSQYDHELDDEILKIVQSIEHLTATDIFFLSKIIEFKANALGNPEALLEDVRRISMILDRVMGTHKKTLKQSQILNSTDILLDALNDLLDYTAVNTSREFFSEEGLVSIVRPRLLIHISDPNVTDITGLALIKNSGDEMTDTNTFMDYNIIPLTADHTIEYVANLGEVEVATWIPRNLLDVMLMPNYTNFITDVSLQNSTVNETPRVVVTLFYNDFIFTNELVGHSDQVDSRVVSVSVPGYGVNLPYPIPLLFRPLKGTSQQTKTCAFWDFDYVGISTVASKSAWSDEGCVNAGRTRDLSGELNVCLCSHLTHFAQLVLGHFPGPEEVGDLVSIRHGEALEVITIIGCVLSMIGVFGILITAMLFESWRKKPGSKVLVQLSLALGLEKFVIGILPIVDSINYPIPCMISGAIMHYAVLAEFSWMLITAWLQFKRYVTVLGVTRPPRFLLKAAAFAWGIPLTIVSIVATINPYVYLPSVDSNVTYCQVSGIAKYVALLAPVTLIISSNIVLFVRVIVSIFGTRKMAPRIGDDKALVIAQLRLAILLFFLLGITWVFGLVALMGGGLVFSYLFCITATLQGFVLFMFFIICDPTTRNLWYSLLRMGGKFSNKVSPNVSASSGMSSCSQRY